jgi:hypothetical protein
LETIGAEYHWKEQSIIGGSRRPWRQLALFCFHVLQGTGFVDLNFLWITGTGNISNKSIDLPPTQFC